jgi:hypothetical protein
MVGESVIPWQEMQPVLFPDCAQSGSEKHDPAHNSEKIRTLRFILRSPYNVRHAVHSPAE